MDSKSSNSHEDPARFSFVFYFIEMETESQKNDTKSRKVRVGFCIRVDVDVWTSFPLTHCSVSHSDAIV